MQSNHDSGLLVDEYRKSWVLRYLREARADLEVAEETPYVEPDPLVEALKKTQLALQYLLGEPFIINRIVQATALSEEEIKDPALQLLVEVKEALNRALNVREKARESMIEYAEGILNLVSEVAALFLKRES
ncbi:MAG TPA: hypothetical protein ENG07_01930 [Candidatus Bathyarchaeota archaeon]|nr:MAG: hypothetical protein CP083_04200 [Candidatus Bathyarchaeota archaeon B24-2]HDM45241.1 hypothetical protein [Candidatus Bathyarchaeota archaeon]